ncbi:hypothetical protein SASPL_112941 [Salvia splendens]|uniref:Uncharacterized protein n=1 Tax=Salvia splendens TaxID=180675 RepID=A0A8X8YFH0_SALSN|nr:hypothetical protein SASPL_112941 [Salvia splendens]
MRLSEEEREPANRDSVRCKVLLGFTSDLTSSGIRDIIRFLVQHRMVVWRTLLSVLHRLRGEFSLPGAVSKLKGPERIANSQLKGGADIPSLLLRTLGFSGFA